MSSAAQITDVTSSFALKITMENFTTNKTPANGSYLIRYTDEWLRNDILIIAECIEGRFLIDGTQVIKQERYITGFIKIPIIVGGAQ